MNMSGLKTRSLALIVAAGMSATFAFVSTARAATPPTLKIVRLGGADRFQTAQVVAAHAFPTGTGSAILARGMDFPGGAKGFADALAGNYLAGASGAPILLTDGATLSSSTLQALSSLKVKNIAVLGGPAAVSDAVISQLEATPSTATAGGNLVVARVAGADRYATAAAVDEAMPASYVHAISGAPTALVARGDDFPDALAAGPLAADAHLPLVLTETGSLSPSAAQALQALGIKSAIILGGPAAVSTAADQQIQALGISTQRLAGANRQQTATAIAAFAISKLGFSNSVVDLARGDAYPDALSGGPQAGKAGPAPILLTSSPTSLGPDTTAFFQGAAAHLGEIDVLGLQSAISDSLLSQLQALLSPTSSTTTTTAGLLPGLNVPGLGTLLNQLNLPQQQALAPVLSSLPAPVLDLIGTLVQNVPGTQLGSLGTLLAQPTSVLGPLTTLVPALPSGGLTGLGGLLSALPAGQVGPTGQLLSALPAGSAPDLASLLTSLSGSQLSSLGGLLSAASPSQLQVVGQILSGISGGGLGGLLGGLVGQLGSLPGTSTLTALSPTDAGLLNTVLGSLGAGQAPLLGGVLSGLGASPAGLLGTFLGTLGTGGAPALGAVLSALPSGQGAALGGTLAGLSPQGATALGGLLTGTPLSSLGAVGTVLSALP